MRTREWALAGSYVGLVAALAASAFWSRDASFTWSREGVAMLLTLPAIIPALPVMYVVGASVWNGTTAYDGDGGPDWPVTLAYALMFAGVATANAGLALALLRARRRRRPREGLSRS